MFCDYFYLFIKLIAQKRSEEYSFMLKNSLFKELNAEIQKYNLIIQKV